MSKVKPRGLLDPKILGPAAVDALRKLMHRWQILLRGKACGQKQNGGCQQAAVYPFSPAHRFVACHWPRICVQFTPPVGSNLI